MCHRIFQQQKDLVFIDSGNGEHTGQVVCGVRQNGRTTYKPVGSLYPDVLKEEDKFPSELSCAERTVSAPQSVTANLTAATAMVAFLYNLLIMGELTARYVTFSSKQINMRAELTKKRKRRNVQNPKKERNRLCKSPEISLCPMRKANAELMV